ncbi:hypothetical protein A3709_19510 [Halioglobus sp. HI00S01]|uniref:hypothetical protein n=1 Tax=Halioglobus sp. HI00S01 TaxID=1822214 RepID=UPI0007C3ED92|nr:hypothetical protein [Halioglobus sp. HI00S01]KZX57813.1 hypothetical protein A3709_19510 [Halioglobus sp. HI00S01]
MSEIAHVGQVKTTVTITQKTHGALWDWLKKDETEFMMGVRGHFTHEDKTWNLADSEAITGGMILHFETDHIPDQRAFFKLADDIRYLDTRRRIGRVVRESIERPVWPTRYYGHD